MANHEESARRNADYPGRIDQLVLVTRGEYGRMSRRTLLQLAPLVLSAALMVPRVPERFIREGLALADWASGKFFSKRRLAPTFADSEVASFERFPYNYSSILDPGVDLAKWTLAIEGRVARPGNYTLAEIRALPRISQNTRHICIEGWDVIGNFGGCRVSEFLNFIGAEPGARFLEVECADDYYESIDIASALHPQSLLCYEMYGRPLDRGHGAPLRLQMPTKLGYKQAKYLTALRVTNVLRKEKGYWEDQGYSWYGGI
jgi:DMSO/TMAO reductase YedYZ molybdopterin-dependent catalytic subunit